MSLALELCLYKWEEDAKRAIGYESYCWSRTDSTHSPTERDVMVVLWAINNRRLYLCGKKFVLITDCSGVTWLLKNQAL